jgi:hypothetical protein
MGRGPNRSAVISTDPEIAAELVLPLVTALDAMASDEVVDASEVGSDRDPVWLLPTRVTLHLGVSPLMFHFLQEVKLVSGRPIPAAFAAVYAEVQARQGREPDPAGRRPIGLEFHVGIRQRFRFVFGVGLQPRDVAHALEDVPATLQRAIERCRRNEDILDSFTRRYVESVVEDRPLELVHLYEGPIYGWQIIT